MGTRSLTRIIPRQEGLAYDKAHEKTRACACEYLSAI